MLPPVYLVAFSGHRPNTSPGRSNKELEACRPHLERAFDHLEEKVRAVGGHLHLVSSIAAGADVVACEVAREKGIPIHVVLPKPEEAFFLTGFDDDLASWKPRSEALLAHAKADPHCSLRVGAVTPTSPDCYSEANSFMLRAADLLLTVTTGEASKSTAGTTHLGEQAEGLKLPTINIDPVAPAFDAANPGYSADAFANSADASHEIFAKLGHHVTCDPDTDAAPARAVADCLSAAARKSSKSYRRGTATAIVCHAVAGFLAAIVASFYYALKTNSGDPAHHFAYWFLFIFALAELILVGRAYYLEYRMHRSHSQPIWLLCRFARELMRGIEAANPFLDPLVPEVSQHHPQWRRFAITCALQFRTESSVRSDSTREQIHAARDIYLDKRLRDQMEHFEKKSSEARPHSRRFSRMAHWAGPVALVVVAVAFLAKTEDLVFHGDYKPDFLKIPWVIAFFFLLLPILVPLFASLSASFLAAFDFGRRSVRYREMHDALESMERWFPFLDSPSDIRTAVRNIEKICVSEQVEWLATQKSGFGN
ncbi:MAG: hypothetical protein WD342_07205 [Verrucomicrobiales bacterium]